MNHYGVRNAKLMKICSGRDVRCSFALLFATALVSLVSYSAAHAAVPSCSDAETALQHWRPIKDDLAASVEQANKLTPELVDCLGSPNPELRDGIAYELLTYWLRNDALNHTTQFRLLESLTANMLEARIEATLSRSFSALILAELMRADAQNSFMADTQRNQLLESAIDALKEERDFRGLDDEIGWIHPVAHLSDLLWRFTLHPKTTNEQIDQILDGVAYKVAPTTSSYRFNESDRLARVISTAIRQSKISDEKMVLWLAQFETPKSMEKWSQAFRSTAGMAELHNTKQFLRALSDQLHNTGAGVETGKYLQELVQGFTQLV